MRRRIHWSVNGRKDIPGGYRLFSAVGFGANAAEAIADALAHDPDRRAWSAEDLTAEPDPIFLQGTSEVREAHILPEVGSTPAPAPILRPLAAALVIALATIAAATGWAHSVFPTPDTAQIETVGLSADIGPTGVGIEPFTPWETVGVGVLALLISVGIGIIIGALWRAPGDDSHRDTSDRYHDGPISPKCAPAEPIGTLADPHGEA